MLFEFSDGSLIATRNNRKKVPVNEKEFKDNEKEKEREKDEALDLVLKENPFSIGAVYLQYNLVFQFEGECWISWIMRHQVAIHNCWSNTWVPKFKS